MRASLVAAIGCVLLVGCSGHPSCSAPLVACGSVCCSANDSCVDGVCCVPCGGGCCPVGDTCVSDACCSNPCGEMCCADGDLCVSDQLGNYDCAATCDVNTDCTSPACCAVVQHAAVGSKVWAACLDPAAYTNPCRCIQQTDCANMPGKPACVPVTFEDKVVAKVYSCAPNDGNPWNGCNGSTYCTTGYDCWTDGWGNNVCVHSCNSDSDCGNPGVACCVKTATCNNFTTACQGTGGCLPCD